MGNLTAKQQTFAQEYLVDLNATQAAIRAGYSARTADVQGPRLLGNVRIQTLVQESRTKLAKKTEITIERILEGYRRIAFGDMRSVMEWNSSGITLKDSEVLNDEDAAMIAEISEVTTQLGGTVRIKMHDKLRALEGIRKLLGFDAPVRVEPPDPNVPPTLLNWMDLVLLAQSADPAKVRRLMGQVIEGTAKEVED